MEKKKLKTVTLGCKVNQAETEALTAFYGNDGGWMVTESTQHADLCIINTCAVTQKAAMQSRQAVRKAIRNHPGALIVVTGCYAQSDPDAFKDIAGVDVVVGQAQKHEIPKLISSQFTPAGTRSKDTAGKSPKIYSGALTRSIPFHQMPAPAFGSRTRPFLKIQDGCDAFCSYCIVPHTRGRSRSLEPDRVVSEISALIEKAAPEIVLSGIHIGRYGNDLKPKTSLLKLLERLEEMDGPHRIRLSSIEPTELGDDLLDFIQESKRVCHHFHIPLQSGDARILERMKRPYGPEAFSALVERIHRRLPDAAIGADVLIGFPGEDRRAFGNTYNMIDRLPVTYLHVFPYSKRPFTPAASFDDQVPSQEVKARCRQMQELGKSKKGAFYQKMIGKSLDIVIEDMVDEQADLYRGLSANYIPVYVSQARAFMGRRTICHITEIFPDRGVAGVLAPDNQHCDDIFMPPGNALHQ